MLNAGRSVIKIKVKKNEDNITIRRQFNVLLNINKRQTDMRAFILKIIRFFLFRF